MKVGLVVALAAVLFPHDATSWLLVKICSCGFLRGFRGSSVRTREPQLLAERAGPRFNLDESKPQTSTSYSTPRYPRKELSLLDALGKPQSHPRFVSTPSVDVVGSPKKFTSPGSIESDPKPTQGRQRYSSQGSRPLEEILGASLNKAVSVPVSAHSPTNHSDSPSSSLSPSISSFQNSSSGISFFPQQYKGNVLPQAKINTTTGAPSSPGYGSVAPERARQLPSSSLSLMEALEGNKRVKSTAGGYSSPRTPVSSFSPGDVLPGQDQARDAQASSFSIKPVFRLSNPCTLVRYAFPRVSMPLKRELDSLQQDWQRIQSQRRGEGKPRPGQLPPETAVGGSQNIRSGLKQVNLVSASDTAHDKERDKEKDKDKKRSFSKGPERRRGEGRPMRDDDVDIKELMPRHIPIEDLLRLKSQGLDLGEIKNALRAEHGIDPPLHAIERELREALRGPSASAKAVKRRASEQAQVKVTQICLPSQGCIGVQDLARLLGVEVRGVIAHLMTNMGVLATVNQQIDVCHAIAVADAFGVAVVAEGSSQSEVSSDAQRGGELRAPVVTIMGHVDHGKTSLLDAIRSSHVADHEVGGITQGISAFQVQVGEQKSITFIDTPGHSAFSEMRKRGANITDIVVLVIAGDDGIMEQTVECIAAAKAARCPIVVAVNKVDKEGVDFRNVLTDLTNHDILVEELGGDVQCAFVSAKTGQGVSDLLEKILIQADVMELRAPVDGEARGVVIEGSMDKRVGSLSTVLVQTGTLRLGDFMLSGTAFGKVRKLVLSDGESVDAVGPSTPVQVLGLGSIPRAGDNFIVTAEESAAKKVASAREDLARSATGSDSHSSFLNRAAQLKDGSVQQKKLIKLPLVVKADVSGAIEAVRSAIANISMEDEDELCIFDIVHSDVGPVSTSDVNTAAACAADIRAFRVQTDPKALGEARARGVSISSFEIVYDLLEDLRQSMRKAFGVVPAGTLLGRAEVLDVFKAGKTGKAAGVRVLEGVLTNNGNIRIRRGKRLQIYQGKISGLRVLKDPVESVQSGECGLTCENFVDFVAGDVIEQYSAEFVSSVE